MADGSARVIRQIADTTEAKLQIYFHQTKIELSSFLTEIEIWQKQFLKYRKFVDAGFTSEKVVMNFHIEMESWPSMMDKHIGVCLQCLAEEFVIVADNFPQEMVKVVKYINEELQRLHQEGMYGSVTDFANEINKEKKSFNSNLMPANEAEGEQEKKGKGILNYLHEQIEDLIKEISIEETLDKQTHLVMQQLLGNKYLETEIEQFKRWWEEVLIVHFKELKQTGRIEMLPSFSVEMNKTKEQRKEHVHWETIDFPISMIGIDITVRTNKTALV